VSERTLGDDRIDVERFKCLNAAVHGQEPGKLEEPLNMSLELNFFEVLVHRIDLCPFVEAGKGDGKDAVARADVEERTAMLNGRERKRAS
jgi:hypothetical protein